MQTLFSARLLGPLGTLQMPLHPFVSLSSTAAPSDPTSSKKIISIAVEDEKDRKQRAMWGTTRALLARMVCYVFMI